AFNFNQAQRARLVTGLLEQCTVMGGDKSVGPPREFLLDLTVGKRVECLLKLAAGRRAGFEFKLTCADEACARELELELTLDELAALQSEADAQERLTVELEEQASLTLRRPSGRDQLAWLDTAYADEDEAAREMIRSLSFEREPRELTREWIEVINRAMDDFDPLVNFNFSAECGECGHVSTLFLDLEELALRELRAAQANLLATVHRLATRYHWSEQEIFAVPHWRRAHYLALIARDEER
ncbi:MAG: hypothetical protein JO360_14315, partial [Acidobacteria bacterium]|nr:hypothetical protein [Acidobacteriota bacterium]